MRLRSTLALTFGALVLAASLAGASLVENVLSSRLRHHSGQDLANLAEQLQQHLDRSLYERWSDMLELATVAQTTVAPPTGRRAWIEALQRTDSHYSWIGFMDPDGTVTAATGGLLEGRSVAARPWFKAALAGPHVGDVHEAALLAKLLPPSGEGGPLRFVDVAAPILDGEGRTVGVIGGHVSWSWARAIERSLLTRAEERLRGIEALIVRADGEVLLGPATLPGSERIDTGLFAGAAPGQPAQAQVTMHGVPHLMGIARSTGYRDYPGLGWTVLVRQPTALAFAEVDELHRRMLLWGVGLALVIAAVGWFVAGWIGEPLLGLARAAQRIERVDQATGAILPESSRFAEIRVLSSAFRTLLGRLADRDAALASANQELEARVVDRTRALAQSEAFARGIVGASPDCVKVLDPEGRLLYVNDMGLCLLGFEGSTSILGRSLDTLWPEAERPPVAARVAAAADGERQRFVLPCRTARGELRWWDITLTPIRDGDGPVERILAVSRDISALKGVQDELTLAKELAEHSQAAAEAASEAKTDFLASMSHEIRTPLNGILGYTELLLDEGSEPLSEDQRRAAERIQSAGAALLTVVNDVLDFSKIEAGQIDLDPQPFSLDALVDNALSIVRGLAGAKRLEITVDVDPGVPQVLLGDQDRLRQVLLNLLNNAVKFTPMGRVSLSIQGGASTDGRPLVHFAITDTGIGIPADKQARLFQRFSQVDGSIRRSYGGTGLGLAISRRLVELMGGQIGVESNPGQGSTFWFTAHLPASEARAVAEEIGVPDGGGEPCTILLVEDLPLNQELARTVLERAGHRVDVVEDGADAVLAVQAKRYDLVLMDVQMPGMDGITATRHIRALDGPAAAVPIVALTANVMPAHVVELRAAGMDGHLAKPFKWAELLRTVAGARQAAPGSAGHDAAAFGDLLDLVGPEQVGQWLGRLADAIAGGVLSPGAAALAPTDLAALAHALVSQAGMLGFAALAAAASRLEEACRDGRPEEAERAAVTALARRALADIAALRAGLAQAPLPLSA